MKPINTNSSEKIFKHICIVAVSILIFCVPGFLKFREYCQQHDYYVFAVDSVKWTAIGFFLIFAARYSYYKFMRKFISKLVDPKYEGEEKIRKIQLLMKLSYDTIYYATMTIICYYLFREEYWFPSMAGGCGSCGQVYKEYPNWPSTKRKELQAYFCFQLGVHSFLLFELFAFRRNTQKKFYEWTLHHTVAVSLMLFSMMCNEITAGVMILIIHDASDIFMALSRFYFQAKLPYKSTPISIYMLIQVFTTWIYFRLVVFPFCLLSNVYINKPTPSDEWYMIHYEYMYLLMMAFVLVGMHIYWTFYMTVSIMRFINKKEQINAYDTSKKQ